MNVAPASLVGVFLILLFHLHGASSARHHDLDPARGWSAPRSVGDHGESVHVHGEPGLNALTGVVVRNAIILVDYANELRRNGVDIEIMAPLAAAASRPISQRWRRIGVTPMILTVAACRRWRA